MSEGTSSTPKQENGDAAVIPEQLVHHLRMLSHDLSNALEIIVQTSYLLSMAELKEPAAEWLRMLDGGVTKALDLNAAMRAYLREHSPKRPL